ncbi:MAG: hypothetical protein HQK65_19890 [Desulfamplus sp.]|nr:hypothetical protein [Desulfamplus sp.]
MKYIGISMFLLFITFIMHNSAFAAAETGTTTAGQQVSVSDSSTSATFTFNPSGNTIIAYSFDATEYAYTTVSSKTDTSNGIAYLMWSENSSGYYQKTQAADQTAEAVPTLPDSGTAITNWVLMGTTASGS